MQLHILDTDDDRLCTATTDQDTLRLLEDLHTEDVTTGAEFYEFAVEGRHHDAVYVAAENQVVFRDLDGFHRLYRIKKVERTHGNDDSVVVRATCECAAYELTGTIVRPSSWPGHNASQILTDLLAGTRWSIGDVDDSVAKDWALSEYPGTWKAVQDLRALFGMETRVRCELASGRLSARYIDILTRRGSDTGKRFEVGKDIKSLKRTDDSYALATAIVPLGKSDAAGVYVTIATATASDKPAGQDWIGDEDARSIYGRPIPGGDRVHIMASKNYSDITDPSDLLAAARVDLAKLKAAAVTIDLDPLLLDQLGWTWEDVRVGDGVYIVDSDIGVATLQRITSLKRSYVDMSKSGV